MGSYQKKWEKVALQSPPPMSALAIGFVTWVKMEHGCGLHLLERLRSKETKMKIKQKKNKLKLPPIFQFRSRKNYRVERWEGIHLFSEFDNRLDHEKTKRIRAELSHRHTYESPELLTWNQGVKPVYNTTTNSVHHPLGGAHFLKRRYPKEYTGVKTGLTPRCCSWLHG